MKRLSLLALLLALLTGCASQPSYTDNGKTGQIKAMVYYDDNKNGVMDATETGAPTKVAISQEVSCPPTSYPSWKDTDASGTYVFPELKPGKYCVFSLGGGGGATTKLTQEVYVSSEQITTVAFGVLKPAP